MKVRLVALLALIVGFLHIQSVSADPIAELSAEKIKLQTELSDVRAQMLAARANNSASQFKSALDMLRNKINQAASNRALFESQKKTAFRNDQC